MADVLWSDIVGAMTLEDGGYTGDLMTVARAHIDDAVSKNRLTQEGAGEIYTALIPAAIQGGIQFATESIVTDEKVRTEKAKQLEVVARVEDEFGKIINDAFDDMAISTSEDIKHSQTIDKMKADNEVADHNVDIALAGIDAAKADVHLKVSQLSREFGKVISGDDVVDLTDINSLVRALPDAANMPLSTWEANMVKSSVEKDIGSNTALGYEADTYYKTYRSLQELMFALANAGVIDSESSPVYAKITEGMERAMNAQAGIWGKSPYIDLDGNATHTDTNAETV